VARLLLEQNLSPRLVGLLSDAYPDSVHVASVGLERAIDLDVWLYARREALVLVSRDADFPELAAARGHPPKVVWLRRGNCTTAEAEALLRTAAEAVESMMADDAVGVIELW
jgi:predicted nuclease of predicted toxin-antitoxin system